MLFNISFNLDSETEQVSVITTQFLTRTDVDESADLDILEGFITNLQKHLSAYNQAGEEIQEG